MSDFYRFYKERFKLFIKNNFNNIYKTKNKDVLEIQNINRKFLNSVPSFINEEIYSKNNYGIPPGIYKNINKEISNAITYTDLISFLANKLFNKKINYLETGVSILKNFLQINNFLENSKMYSYEIEKINPIFKHLFKEVEKNYYVHNSLNLMHYFEGDLMNRLDNESFNEKIKEIKFDIVFSDAHHQPWSLIWEYKKIIKPNLNKNFLIYFDDADFPGMTEAIKEVREDLKKINKKIYSVSFYVNGWTGQYEKMHKNIIISTFDIENIFKKEKIKLFKLKKL